MDRTQVNRMYLLAATSQGYAYPIGTNPSDTAPLTAPTIFDALQKAGVSWKIYQVDSSPTYLTMFQPYAPPAQLPSNVVPIAQFFTDVQNGTLPAVAMIEGGYDTSGQQCATRCGVRGKSDQRAQRVDEQCLLEGFSFHFDL
jgi:phospholipase C